MSAIVNALLFQHSFLGSLPVLKSYKVEIKNGILIASQTDSWPRLPCFLNLLHCIQLCAVEVKVRVQYRFQRKYSELNLQVRYKCKSSTVEMQ